MKLSLTSHRSYSADRVAVFDFTNANFGTFVGFGIVPGIRDARYETEGEPGLGSRRRITKTDGTEHIEEIVVFERPALHVSRIAGLSPPLSWLVREAEDGWRFTAVATGTRVDRTFTFELTSALWFPFAFPLMHLFPASRHFSRSQKRGEGASCTKGSLTRS